MADQLSWWVFCPTPLTPVRPESGESIGNVLLLTGADCCVPRQYNDRLSSPSGEHGPEPLSRDRKVFQPTRQNSTLPNFALHSKESRNGGDCCDSFVDALYLPLGHIFVIQRLANHRTSHVHKRGRVLLLLSAEITKQLLEEVHKVPQLINNRKDESNEDVRSSSAEMA